MVELSCHNESASPVSLKAQVVWFSRMAAGEVAIRSVASVVAYFVDEGTKAFPFHVAVAAVEHGLQRKLTDAEEWFSSGSGLRFRFDLIFFVVSHLSQNFHWVLAVVISSHCSCLMKSDLALGQIFPWCGWKIGHSH